jgi:hypothetical protein
MPLHIFYNVKKISAHIAPNVPGVYDVFASPIKETAGFQGLEKCGWREAWERSDLADRNPGGPKARSIYRPVMRSF